MLEQPHFEHRRECDLSSAEGFPAVDALPRPAGREESLGVQDDSNSVQHFNDMEGLHAGAVSTVGWRAGQNALISAPTATLAPCFTM